MEKIILKKQPILSKIINNINESKNNVQAYILINEDEKKLQYYCKLLSKVLICPYKFSQNCNNCNICRRIDEEIFNELKIINPENSTIKKDDILKIREDFQTNSIEGKNQVYIINQAEKLNSASANSILKFLEEPDSNTVGIFSTTNINLVIATIVSRCQSIKLNNEEETGMEFLCSFTKLSKQEVEFLIDFIKQTEKSRTYSFSILKKEFINKFSDKNSVSSAINVFILFYKDILSYKVMKKTDFFDSEIFDEVLVNQEMPKITNKINFLLENLEKLKYNVNILLFMSNLIIGLGEINDGNSNRNKI